MDQITRTPQQLAAVLRRRRRQLGLSQVALARQIAVRQATISHIESSSANTRIATLLNILAALELELAVRPRTKSTAQDIEDLF